MTTQPQAATTVTILFTDLVNSTELLQRAGDERAQRIFQAHHNLLKDAVARHGGHEVKWLGDGLMVAFPSAGEALRCAIAMQQAALRPIAGERLGVRVGLNVGDALRDESDYFGTPVVVAKRLCDRAEAGQVLCSALVAGLLSGQESFRFEDRGALELKGIAAPVAACELLFEREPRPTFTQTPFVAREAEIARLEEAFREARSGRGRVVMLVGEPGIGKTRTAEEFAERAQIEGALTLWGHCYEAEWSPPYGPFVEAIEGARNEEQGARVEEALREIGAEHAALVAKLAPGLGVGARSQDEVAREEPEPAGAAEMQPEEERFRLLEAVSQLFLALAASAPGGLVLMLDDLHWGGAATVAMLRHLARSVPKAPILLLGTYRDVDLARTHPLADALAALRRESGYERVLLRGLDSDGVKSFFEARARHELPRVFTDLLHQQTEGNPFFIEEIIHHLTEIGVFYKQEGVWTADAAAILENIPEGVKEVIGRRLSRLSEAANAALTHASVLGREFDFDLLQALTGTEEEALLTAMEEALAAQLIEEHRGAGGAGYRFTHALVQETLYDELSIARKQRLHLRAGRALEEVRAGRLEPYVAQLAHHFTQGNDVEKAIEYSRRAGEAALALSAYEEAIAHWQAALELMEEVGTEPAERARLLERLGDIHYVAGIGFDKGIELLERALAIYERAGARGKVAAMHSRLGRGMVSFQEPGMDIAKGTAHLEAAREMLEVDAPGSAGLAFVEMALATACLYKQEVDQLLGHGRRALEIGERLKSRTVTANALVFVGYGLASSGKLGEGFESLEKAWNMADEQGLTFVSFLAASMMAPFNGLGRRDPKTGMWWAMRGLEKPGVAGAPLQRDMLRGMVGQFHVLAGEMEDARETPERAMQASWFLAALDGAEGEWDAAEKRLLQLIAAARSRGDINGEYFAYNHLGHLWLARGEYGGAEQYLDATVLALMQGERKGWLDVDAALALVCAETGRPEEARRHVDACLGLVAEGEDWGGTAGRVALAEGAVAAAEGRVEEAEGHFERAIETFRRYTLPWDEAEALRCWGRALLRAGERERGIEKLDEAIGIYRRIGAGERWVEVVERERSQRMGSG